MTRKIHLRANGIAMPCRCLFWIDNDFLFEMKSYRFIIEQIKVSLKSLNCPFERSDSDLNPFEMIYDCHFEMTAKKFRQQNNFGPQQRRWKQKVFRRRWFFANFDKKSRSGEVFLKLEFYIFMF